ncbi:MAG: tetratricopeptide repeat protein, partial [Burkholderiales bacterium]
MKIFQSLLKTIGAKVLNQKTFSVEEVRELISRREFALARQAVESLSPLVSRKEVEQQCLIGEINYQEGNDEQAQAMFEAALVVVPGKPSAHLGLSLIMAEKGDFSNAYRHAFFAYSIDGNNPRFLAQLAYCQIQLKNYAAAERPLRKATLLAPDDAYAWNNLGLVLRAKRKYKEARACFERSSQLRPDYTTAASNLALIEQEIERAPTGGKKVFGEDGFSMLRRPDIEEFTHVVELEEQGETPKAIELCEELLGQHFDSVELILALNFLYQKAGDPAAGVDTLEAFLVSNPECTEVLNALGFAKLDLLEPKAAQIHFELAHSHDSTSFDTFRGMAQALTAQDRFDEAATWLEKALAVRPDDLSLKSAWAVSLINRCQYNEGLAACQALEDAGYQVIAIGAVMAYMGRFEEALTSLNAQIELHPHDAGMRFHRGSIRLLHLDFKAGWEDYAYRAFTSEAVFRVLPFPLWQGEPLEGKKVVVLAEQGLGDQVMFASCLPDLLGLHPAEVVLEVIDRIAPTIERSFPQVRVIVSNQSRALEWVSQCPGMDYYIPLGDLPRYFRNSLSDFPDRCSFLRAAPDRVLYWRRQLESTGPGPYIGFSWKGGTERTRSVLRTVRPQTFKAFAHAIAARWVCLQYGPVQDAV